MIENRLEVMRTMYSQGLTLEEIGNSFGITKQRVSQLMGVRHPRSLLQRCNSLPSGLKDKITDAIWNGQNVHDIARDLGVSDDLVSWIYNHMPHGRGQVK